MAPDPRDRVGCRPALPALGSACGLATRRMRTGGTNAHKLHGIWAPDRFVAVHCEDRDHACIWLDACPMYGIGNERKQTWSGPCSPLNQLAGVGAIREAAARSPEGLMYSSVDVRERRGQRDHVVLRGDTHCNGGKIGVRASEERAYSLTGPARVRAMSRAQRNPDTVTR